MKIAIKCTNKLIELPNEIFLDQLMEIDLGYLEQLGNIDLEKAGLKEIQPLFKWIVKFFKAIGVKHRFTMKEFIELMKGEDFTKWLTNLFGNLA